MKISKCYIFKNLFLPQEFMAVCMRFHKFVIFHIYIILTFRIFIDDNSTLALDFSQRNTARIRIRMMPFIIHMFILESCKMTENVWQIRSNVAFNVKSMIMSIIEIDYLLVNLFIDFQNSFMFNVNQKDSLLKNEWYIK